LLGEARDDSISHIDSADFSPARRH